MNVIELEHVTLTRKGKSILEDVSWNVRTHQHCVLLGANGSGKTALLQTITGYMSPSSGRIQILGKLHGTYDLRELRKSIGWVSSSLQERIHPHDSALEVVVSGKLLPASDCGKIPRLRILNMLALNWSLWDASMLLNDHIAYFRKGKNNAC